MRVIISIISYLRKTMTKTVGADVFREPVDAANRQQEFRKPITSELKA